MENITMQVIARMRSDFSTKFGIPRQSGLVEQLRSTVVFEPEFRNADALRGIEDFSHLWIRGGRTVGDQPWRTASENCHGTASPAGW